VTDARFGSGVLGAPDPDRATAPVRFRSDATLSKSEVFDLCDVLWQTERELRHVGCCAAARAVGRWIEIVECRLAAGTPDWADARSSHPRGTEGGASLVAASCPETYGGRDRAGGSASRPW